MQSFYFMIDDIINRRSLRRGKPCWYRYNDVPEAVFNDGYLIYKAIFYIIQKHFSGREYYVDLMEIFYEVSKDMFLSINHKHKYKYYNLAFLLQLIIQ